MKHIKSKKKAMTIVELMVSLVGIAVVMMGLLGLITNTLTFTTKTMSIADGMQSLTDVSAYLSDNFRRASEVAISAITINGESCQLSDQNPCIAIVIPESSLGGTIDSYLLIGYKLIPRIDLDAAYKVSSSWADDNTAVLMEYRAELCGPNSGILCNGQPNMPDNVSAQEYFVADFLIPNDELPSPMFSYDGISKIGMRLQIKTYQRGKILYTPKSPYILTVSMRN